MSIKMRLLWSNLLIILVPVIVTALVGILCVAVIVFSMFRGIGFNVENSEKFSYVSMAVTETVEHKLENGGDLTSLAKLLDGNGMSLNVISGDKTIFSYGESKKEDAELMSASESLKNEMTISSGRRSVHIKEETIKGVDYRICIFGGNIQTQSRYDIESILGITIILLFVTILLSIIFTDRFVTKFVFKKIETALDILTYGVRQISDGNLDYLIDYQRKDEFLPVCEDFNRMALRLKESVELTKQQEKSRKELIAGISHDIRSPLTSIQAYAEGLLDGVTRTEADEKRYIETIKKKADELEHMISQLFLFSKMELGYNAYNPCVMRLDETVDRIVSEQREEYGKQGMEFETNLCTAEIYADPVQIRRIVNNILENSLKYKEKKRGRIIINMSSADDGWHLSISDDGPGVPQESLSHLFEVFYRSDPSRHNPNQGSGLGLAIVANAVHQLGGTISAKNGNNRGLEIEIIFPYYEVNEDDENIDC